MEAGRECMCGAGGRSKVLIHLSLHAKSSTELTMSKRLSIKYLWCGHFKGLLKAHTNITDQTEDKGFWSAFFFLSNDVCVRAYPAISVVAHWHYVGSEMPHMLLSEWAFLSTQKNKLCPRRKHLFFSSRIFSWSYFAHCFDFCNFRGSGLLHLS